MPKHSRPARRPTIQSNTYRFFVDAGAIHGRDVLLDDSELTHQIGTVLRLRPGEKITLLDNSGWQHVVALESVERGRVSGTVERKELAGGEPRTKLTLYVALMRPERFEYSVLPIPAMQYLSRRLHIGHAPQFAKAGRRFSLKARSPSIASGCVVA